MNSKIKNCTYPGCNLPVHLPHDENLCLGHTSIANKHVSTDDFANFIRTEKIYKGDFNLEGFIFISADLNIAGGARTFTQKVNLSKCEFHEIKQVGDKEYSLFFKDLIFRDSVDFTGSKFMSGIYFQNCKFNACCYLDKVTIKGETNFEGGVLSKLHSENTIYHKEFKIKMSPGVGELIFEKQTVFEEDFIIMQQAFLKSVTFNNVVFKKHFAILDSPFKEYTEFTDCKFKSSSFAESKFESGCKFDRSAFSGNTIFKDVQFLKKVDFYDTKFENDDSIQTTFFDDANFNAEANWARARFQNVYFTNSTFKEKCDFNDTIFNGRTDFENSKFLKSVFFITSKFSLQLKDKQRLSSRILFKHTSFNDRAEFNGSQLNGELRFENISLIEKSTFYFADLRFEPLSRVVFKNINFPSFTAYFENTMYDFGEKSAPAMIGFRNCNLKDQYFTNNSMSIFSFYKCVFDSAIFISNQWDSRPERIFRIKYKRRNIIFEDHYTYYQLNMDEKQRVASNVFYYFDDLSGFEEIASLYRRFKVALDRTKDYEQAGWFYFNEHEMKLKEAMKKNKLKFGLFFLYKIFAGYGEKPLWSFFWFLFSTIVFSIVNILNGIKFNGREIINYNWEFSRRGLNNFINFSWFSDFLTSFAFTISKIIPLGYLPIPKEQFMASTPAEYILSVANTIILLFFLTFIAVGLKRLFRRF